MMTSLNNVNNSTFKTMLKTLSQDKASNKIIETLNKNEKISFNVVEDNKKDEVHETTYDTSTREMKVTINIDDIEREAKHIGISPEVYLAQQAGSIMAGVYLQQEAIEDGKDPSEYVNNAEFQVAKLLIADGMVRRTLAQDGKNDAKDLEYLNNTRANMAEAIKKQHGDDFIKTGGSDAFERLEALGFVGLNTGGWADKIVATFGEDDELKLGDLDELEETDKTDKTDKTKETAETDETDETAETDEAKETKEAKETDETDDEIARLEKERDDALKAQKEAEENSGKLFGLPSWLVALGAGVGGYFLGNQGKGDLKEEVAENQNTIEYYRNLAIQNQQRLDQLKAQQAQVPLQTPVVTPLKTTPYTLPSTPVAYAPTTFPVTPPYSNTPFATYNGFAPSTVDSFANPYLVQTPRQVIPPAVPQSDWYSA